MAAVGNHDLDDPDGGQQAPERMAYRAWQSSPLAVVDRGNPKMGIVTDEFRNVGSLPAQSFEVERSMTREELGNSISANIASVTMGCTNIEVTSAIMRDVDLYAPRRTLKSTQAMRDRIRELMSREQDDYDRAVECVVDDLEALLNGVPAQRSLEPQAWQRRNIGKDGTSWSSWYLADDAPTSENVKWDGVYHYEYRQLYALTSTSSPAQRRQEPEACPYAIDGCVLENQEIGPCLCALTSSNAPAAQGAPATGSLLEEAWKRYPQTGGTHRQAFIEGAQWAAVSSTTGQVQVACNRCKGSGHEPTDESTQCFRCYGNGKDPALSSTDGGGK